MSQLGLTVKKSEDISEWYTQLMLKADMADYTDVSGCLAYKPRAYAIWEKIVQATDKQFKQDGIQNCYFPVFIPEKLLNKEATHVEGFAPEVAWVTHGGNTELGERLAIRPTSETIMYESFSKWIRSWRDLPMRLNQWNNVVRWEFKNPVPFLRGREFLWNEGHTCWANQEDAMKEGDTIIGIYTDIMENWLAVPSLIGKKTEREKFAGAEYTISMEQFLPSGKAIQGPDFHHDGQIFAKAFDIKFKDQDEKEQYVYQNTFAISTRVIGIMLMIHGDDKGMVIPPKVAPQQIAVVPIFTKDKDSMLNKAKEVEQQLQNACLTTTLDDRDYVSPGFRFNDLELQGIPIRIEIGPKDLEKGEAVVVRRDTLEKQSVAFDQLADHCKKLLDDIHNNLFAKAKHFLEESIVEVDNIEDFKKVIQDKKIAKVLYCNDPEVEEQIKEQTGATARNIPMNQEEVEGKCFFSGKPAKYYTYFAKAY